MNTTAENKNSKLVIIILAVLLALLSVFTIYNMKSNSDKVDVMMEEKLNLEKDLDAKIAELDAALTSNVEMDAELNSAKNELIALRDSIGKMKSIDRQMINKFNRRISDLEKTNKMLLQEADSLKTANKFLNVAIDSAHANIEKQAQTIQEKVSENESLNQEKTNLTEKVTKGAALKISNIKVIAMKERSSGALKETESAKRVDAFRSSFIVRENPIADQGTKMAHIVIQDASGKIIGATGNFYDIDGQFVEYTDKTEVTYDNNDLEVIVVSAIPENSLEKGVYYVKVYLENKYLGSTKITLK